MASAKERRFIPTLATAVAALRYGARGSEPTDAGRVSAFDGRRRMSPPSASNDRNAPHANALDSAVLWAHGLRLGPLHPHPYLLMADLAIAAELLLAVVYSALVEGFSFGRFLCVFLAVQASYEFLYLPLKFRVLGERARSFLQDTVLVILPSYFGACALFGLPLRAAADLLGLVLPLGLGLMRIGCFFGGCCYGRPAPWGVWYERESIRAVEGWRRFTPGPWPGTRVLPLQLLESSFNFLLLAALALRLAHRGAPDGRALPLYLLAYSVFRLAADGFRGHRHRPKRDPLSEAQWTSMAVFAITAGFLWATS